MSTFLKLSAIAKSNNLKDMMILMFESENQKDFITADNMNMIAENLSIRVSEREMLIDNHKSEHLEGLHKSKKYVPTYTLGGFVWSFKVWILVSFEMSNRWWNKLAEVIQKESNPIYELRPTLAKNNYEWWTSTLDFLQVYVPRTPIRKPDLFDAYLQKVLGRERNSDVVQKLEFSDDYSGLSIEFYEELNHAFLELVESSFIASVGTQSDDDTEEVCHETEDFLLEEVFMRRLLEEERLLLKEERLFEEEKKDLLRINNAIDHIWISKDLDLYLGKSGRLRSWTEADKVFIPINETGQHWCLAEFDIKSDVVTLYAGGGLYDLEFKDWYIKTKDCLKKGIEKSTNHITFRIAENVPKQGVSLVTVGSGERLAQF
nr:phospholipase-like protein [Tanacetum cinerariifolium]